MRSRAGSSAPASPGGGNASGLSALGRDVATRRPEQRRAAGIVSAMRWDGSGDGARLILTWLLDVTGSPAGSLQVLREAPELFVEVTGGIVSVPRGGYVLQAAEGAPFVMSAETFGALFREA